MPIVGAGWINRAAAGKAGRARKGKSDAEPAIMIGRLWPSKDAEATTGASGAAEVAEATDEAVVVAGAVKTAGGAAPWGEEVAPCAIKRAEGKSVLPEMAAAAMGGASCGERENLGCQWRLQAER